MSDYTGLRAQFLKTALTPDAPCKFHIPSQPVHTANLAMNLVPMIDLAHIRPRSCLLRELNTEDLKQSLFIVSRSGVAYGLKLLLDIKCPYYDHHH